MRINGYRCDGCGKEHLFDPSLLFQHIGDVMPDGWFIVRQETPVVGRVPWVFCSKKCLRHHPLAAPESSSHVNAEASFNHSAEALLNHYKAPGLEVACNYEGVKYQGVIDAVEEST